MSREVAEGGEAFFDGEAFAFNLAVDVEGLFGGFDDEGAAVAVEDGGLAIVYVLAEVAEANDGGDVDGAGNDGCVGGVGADIGGKSDDVLPVEG